MIKIYNIVLTLMLLACGGCANSVYDQYYKDARQLNTSGSQTEGGSVRGRVVIRYPLAYDESAKHLDLKIDRSKSGLGADWFEKADRNLYRYFGERANGSTYYANFLYQVLKARCSGCEVVLQPYLVYDHEKKNVKFGSNEYDVAVNGDSKFFEHDFPGASVYIDISYKSRTIEDSPLQIYSHNGVLSRRPGQSFGRWLSLSFEIYTSNALAEQTNGVLATNERRFLTHGMGVGHAQKAGGMGGVHSYLISGCDNPEQLKNLVYRKLPVRQNGVLYFSSMDSFVIDEEKINNEPVKGDLKSTAAEYRALGSLADVIQSSLQAVDQEKAVYYTSIPWVSFYDPDLADRMVQDKLAARDDKRLALLKIIEKEEMAFLQSESDRQSDTVVYGDFGKNFRKIRAAENNNINEIMSAHSQASNAALVAGLSTMHSQLNSYAMRSGGLSGAMTGLQSNINALNSIANNQANMNSAMSGIAAASGKFNAAINSYRDQVYRFVSQKTGKAVEIKVGSLGELRYQFLKLYRAETKDMK